MCSTKRKVSLPTHCCWHRAPRTVGEQQQRSPGCTSAFCLGSPALPDGCGEAVGVRVRCVGEERCAKGERTAKHHQVPPQSPVTRRGCVLGSADGGAVLVQHLHPVQNHDSAQCHSARCATARRNTT